MQSISAHHPEPEDHGAILPTRLEWLCGPEQIEQTLHLLYYLNSWRRANQQLLYADRQGLHEVQALVLEQATRVGAVQVAIYVDGTARFPGELLLESAAENAARGVLIHIKGLRDPDIWPPFWPDGDRVYQQYIRPLYKRITGKDFKFVTEAADAVEIEQLREYMQGQLHKLIERAKATRQPVPLQRLADLCITPIDLLHIRDNRIYFLDGYETWGDLDISDQRKLDPEGYSEIAFQYRSPTAEFVFHLPFRWAETFVPVECIRELQRTPGSSRERGVFQGKPIDDEESLRHPVKEILQDLGVDIARICPHNLQDKEAYLASPAIRDILWPTRGYDHEDWNEDPWDGVSLPPNTLYRPLA
jgi:hypothetical protein